MFVKICGVSTPEGVQAAVRAGADAIGFVLSPSPRQVSADTARLLRQEVPPGTLAVAVFATTPAAAAREMALRAGADTIQLHGAYPAEAFEGHDATLIRAVSFDAPDLETGAYGEDILLVDAPVPGRGDSWDYSMPVLRGLKGKWVLAGGLTPDNVTTAISLASPWGVDVSSGVESSRGVKDTVLIERFVQAAKSA
jgi:phosphoribosylanthranilate isomerase